MNINVPGSLRAAGNGFLIVRLYAGKSFDPACHIQKKERGVIGVYPLAVIDIGLGNARTDVTEYLRGVGGGNLPVTIQVAR